MQTIEPTQKCHSVVTTRRRLVPFAVTISVVICSSVTDSNVYAAGSQSRPGSAFGNDSDCEAEGPQGSLSYRSGKQISGGIMNVKYFVGRMLMTAMIAIAVSTSADANPSSTTGTLTVIQTGWSGEGVYMTITPAPSPACNGKLFMPTSAIQYKENLSLAMLAYAQGLTITIYYSPTCDANGNVNFVSLSIGS